ncbi:Imm53 family immunity protein [Sphingobacterium endophyticum]|uniref:Imm53 family immunity protein n=1 Tax=Sphingobacterium endophyticum TaxID=2546448 RepID=UPI0012E258E3|nr:Imm53 family immunity protein [Sphingobacterium endophyticum]
MEENLGLIKWFKDNCDGDWEHSYGVRIMTLDNPGWVIEIDLIGTELEGFEFEDNSLELEEDWYSISCNGKIFKGAGDPNKLNILINKFLDFKRCWGGKS